MTTIHPIIDDALGEDIAWRIWHLNDAFGFMEKPSPPFPKFVHMAYKQVSQTWDHDHCAGCTKKFMEAGVYKSLATGWVTQFGTSFEEWLCNDCYRILGDIEAGRLIVRIASK